MEPPRPAERIAPSRTAPVLDQRQRPLRDLRISVTDRCNFRCPYCMPAELFGEAFRFLPKEELLSFEEITRLSALFVALGARKLRITGGEPLLRADLPLLIRDLAAIPGVQDIALTTNGMLLSKSAAALRAAGLHRATVSLDSLHPVVFRQLSGGRGAPADVLAGIAAAEAAGFTPLKINCVVQRGVNEESILELAAHFRGTPHIVRFIEFMDVGTLNGWRLEQVVPAREIVERIGAEWPLVALEPSAEGEVARRYGYADGRGEIGLITSVTQPFCSGCTRARLSTEGRLVTCLFAADGIDLRSPLRTGADDQTLIDLISSRWRGRDDAWSELRSAATQRERIEMFRLGG